MRLRDYLREADPSLHHHLETAWAIAESEWIPTLIMDSESYAGLPHLLSVEDHMDKVAESCRSIWSRHGNTPFGFNAMELYVALASVLFHDIGRARPSDDHGKVSQEILNRHWAQLGVVSQRIALEIGNIVAFHTMKREKWPYSQMTIVHPWGPVHTQAIGSLLRLADELDTAYTRVVPQYVKPPELRFEKGDINLDQMGKMMTKGTLRDFISAVDLDATSHVIKTVVFPYRLLGAPRDESRRPLTSGESGWRGWLAELNKNQKITHCFYVQDYFHHYLEHLRLTTDEPVLRLLAHEFSMIGHRALMEALEKLDTREEASDVLFHLLQLGNRLDSGYPSGRTVREGRELAALQTTMEVFTRTVERVHAAVVGLARSPRATILPRVKFLPPKREMETVAAGIYAVQLRGDIIERSRRGRANYEQALQEAAGTTWTEWLGSTQGSISKEMAGLRNTLQSISELAQTASSNPVSLIAAHVKLVQTMRWLIYLDMRSIASCNFRPLESWSVSDFHANLRALLTVYLQNAQSLLSIASGNTERWTTADRDPDLTLLEIDASLSEEDQDSSSDSESLPGEGQASTTDAEANIAMTEYLTALRGEFKAFIDLRQSAERVAKAPWEDIEYAVRMLFMRWLGKDIEDKNQVIEQIADGLAQVEIPFQAWLIDYGGLLFDAQWYIRTEPSLPGSMMENTVDAVCALHAGIVRDDAPIPWEALAARLREPKMERVKTATERLSAIMRVCAGLDTNELNELAIALPDSGLRLHFGHLLKGALRTYESGAPLGRSFSGLPEAAVLRTSHSSWSLSRDLDGTSERTRLRAIASLAASPVRKRETN